MFKRIAIFLCTVVSLPSFNATGKEAFFSPTHPCIRYTGRVDDSNPAYTRFDWSYITIETVFEGTSCTIGLSAKHDMFNVFIDGKLSHRIETDRNHTRYELATNLADTVHHLLLTKRYETCRYITRCTGLYLDSGRTLRPLPERPRYLIEFLGASTLLGHGNESTKTICDSTYLYSDAYYSYGPVAARELGAECRMLAITRRGLVRNYHSPFITSFKPFRYYYDATLWNKPEEKKLNHAKRPPQVIVFTLGTNDFSTPPQPTEQLFANHAFSFIRELYRLFPDVHIVFLSPTREPLRTFMRNIVERERQEGNRRISFLAYDKFPDWRRGCDWHPNVRAHHDIATQLAAHLKPILKNIR